MENKDFLISSKSKMNVVTQNKNGLMFEVNGDLPYSSSHKNLIYINGSQLDHYNRYGKSIFSPIAGNDNFGHVGDWYNMKLKPYVFKYIVNKDSDGAYVFAKGLKKAIDDLKLDSCILIGKSYGGVIASVAAKYDNVANAFAINPSLCGSSLSDLELLKKYRKTLIDWGIYLSCLRLLEPKRQFTKENASGLDVEQNPKIHIYGGTINHLNPKTPMQLVMKFGANKIYSICGKLSDGMAIWDQDYYDKKGFNTTILEHPYHYLSQNASYMKIPFTKVKSLQ